MTDFQLSSESLNTCKIIKESHCFWDNCSSVSTGWSLVSMLHRNSGTASTRFLCNVLISLLCFVKYLFRFDFVDLLKNLFSGVGLAAMLLERLPWICFASLSSFYWYLLVNFKSYIRSAGFSSSSHNADNQAQPLSCENALLLPFILWSKLILARWQEDAFSSICSLYWASTDCMVSIGTHWTTLVPRGQIPLSTLLCSCPSLANN